MAATRGLGKLGPQPTINDFTIMAVALAINHHANLCLFYELFKSPCLKLRSVLDISVYSSISATLKLVYLFPLALA